MIFNLFEIIATWLVGMYMGVGLATNPDSFLMWLIAGGFTLYLAVLWVKEWAEDEKTRS